MYETKFQVIVNYLLFQHKMFFGEYMSIRMAILFDRRNLKFIRFPYLLYREYKDEMGLYHTEVYPNII